jgi:hypothetical protein
VEIFGKSDERPQGLLNTLQTADGLAAGRVTLFAPRNKRLRPCVGLALTGLVMTLEEEG